MNDSREDPLGVIKDLTGRLGADVSIEAVGTPATFELAVELVRPGGRVANIGVHGEAGRCTWKTSGSRTSPSLPAWWTPPPPRP